MVMRNGYPAVVDDVCVGFGRSTVDCTDRERLFRYYQIANDLGHNICFTC